MPMCPGLHDEEGNRGDSEGNRTENNPKMNRKNGYVHCARYDISHLCFISSTNPDNNAMRKWYFYPFSDVRNQAWKRSLN